jgi:serine/threonine protein kinase
MENAPPSSGAFGDVYKGRWRGNTVAIKIMRSDPNPSHGKEKSRRINFEKEAQLLYTLSHPNIVKVIIECRRFAEHLL